MHDVCAGGTMAEKPIGWKLLARKPSSGNHATLRMAMAQAMRLMGWEETDSKEKDWSWTQEVQGGQK